MHMHSCWLSPLGRGMDSLTAGTALILVQCCVALVMAGFYFAAPSENCTKYWALSGICIAVGVLIAILSHRSANNAMLLTGSSLVMVGMACQWQGILAFYKKPPQKAAWYICLLFALLLALMLMLDTTIRQRTPLFSGTVIMLLGLSLHAVWRGQGMPRTFVQALVPSAIILLLCSHLLKLTLVTIELLGTTLPRSTLEIIAAYLVPLVGTFLFSIGLPLLYFERMAEENRHLATYDELSKLLNRRAIGIAGEREWNLARRLQRNLTVVFIDIDLFKHFNDAFGHAAGDTVIAEVACILTRTCRTIDLVGRYGGEEFLIVLPDADCEDAADIGQRLIEAVRDYRFLEQHQVTISAGLATLSANGNCTWGELIQHADAALYKAKSLGRNRFCT
jgi:diguanylate cyclase (GGDEF)-like protein